MRDTHTMSPSRMIRLSMLAVLSIGTAGAVLAARPATQAAPAAKQTMLEKKTPSLIDRPAQDDENLLIPDDAQSRRLKIRFSNGLGVRLLPNGELLSLTGQDLTDLSAVLEDEGVRLQPAVSVPEKTINSLRLRTAVNGADSIPDFAATYWVELENRDGQPADVANAAKRLHQLGEVDTVAFARNETAPPVIVRPTQDRPLQDAPTRIPAESSRSLINEQGGFIDPGYEPRKPAMGPMEHIETPSPIMSPEEAFAILEAQRLESVDRGLAAAQANSKRQGSGERVLGEEVGACCYSIHVPNITSGGGATSFGPGNAHYCIDAVTEEVCTPGGLGGPPADAVHFAFKANEGCDACEVERWGTCCATELGLVFGIQDGEESTIGDCDPLNWGDNDPAINPDFPGTVANPALPDDPGGFGTLLGANRSLTNCESCRVVYGICCIGPEGIDVAGTTPDNTFAAGPKFALCNNFDPANPPLGAPPEAFGFPTPVQNWMVIDNFRTAPDPANLVFRAGGFANALGGALGAWAQPLFTAPGSAPLETYTGGRTPQTSWLPTGSGTSGWQGYDVPDELTLPNVQPVIGTSRLVTNDDEASAWSRCVAMGGTWFAGGEIQYEYIGADEPDPSTYPELFYGDPDNPDFPGYLCGLGSGSLGSDVFSSLDPPTLADPLDYVMGSCTSGGVTTIMSWNACADAAAGLGIQARAIWSSSIIDVKQLNPITGVHNIHGNMMRPMWSIWYSPGTNSLPNAYYPPPPIGPDFLGSWSTWCPPANPFNYNPLLLDEACMTLPFPDGDPGSERRPYLVPPWEFLGMEIQWTGWNPAVWATDTDFFGRSLDPDLFPAVNNTLKDVWNAAMPDIGGVPLFAGDFNYTGIFAASISPEDGTPSIIDPGHFGPAVRFGFPPTGTEFESSQGLASGRGDPLVWDDPTDRTESWWPVWPRQYPFVYHWQVEGGVDGVLPGDSIYPFGEGWQRWTLDGRMFDIDQSVSLPSPANAGQAITPEQAGQANPAFQFGQRYLNTFPQGTTRWTYLGDQTTANPHSDDAFQYSSFYIINDPDHPLSGEPTRGSCFFTHSATFPTLSGTRNNDAYPEEEEVYLGNYCDEVSCCDAVAAEIARCCTDVGPAAEWDATCVQIAVDTYLRNQTSGLDFAQFTCSGLSPYTVPQYSLSWDTGTTPPTPNQAQYSYYPLPIGAPFPAPNPNIPLSIAGPGTYNPDPQNVALNPYLAGMVENGRIAGPDFIRSGVLPRWADPATTGGACDITDQSRENTFWPVFPVAADHSNEMDPQSGLFSTEFLEYAEVRDRSARLAQFIPRCQGIFSGAGQCNVPGNKSGWSAWETIAEDETLITGCQDFDCCIRVIDTLLAEKDASAQGDDFSDFEWVNFGHLGVPVGADPPLLSGQWTPYMAMIARDICYPNTPEVTDPGDDGQNMPDFHALQFNAGVRAFQQEFVLGDTAAYREWIQGPDGSEVSNTRSLKGLIPAPLSWVDPTLDNGVDCLPTHQNIYEMCPRPYYRGDGLALWPTASSSSMTPFDAEDTFTSAVRYLNEANSADPADWVSDAGEGVKIAVVGEAAWIQEWTPPLPGAAVQGAVHNDLENVILEGSAISLPDVTMDFNDEAAAARCTAVLGVLAATDNDFGVTGLAHEATTYFFPTRSVPVPGGGPVSRIDDAFLNAINLLSPGDVLVVAMQPNAPNGFALSDIEIATYIQNAAQNDIHVVLPAGDYGIGLPGDLSDVPGIANMSIVAGAVPGSESNYMRWWSSNYSDTDTVNAASAGGANLCAWGGMVTTTGGNANLTVLTYPDGIDAQADGTYELNRDGRANSYTNDFGSQLDGSLAAASQIAAVLANAQGLLRGFYGASLKPDAMLSRMYDTAVIGKGATQPAGMANTPGPRAAGNRYSWDLNEVDGVGSRFVGRMPQLSKLVTNVTQDVPAEEEFVDEIEVLIVRLDVIAGELLDGSKASIEFEDGEAVELRSMDTGPGPAPFSNFYIPGGSIDYSSPKDRTDIMVTLNLAEDAISTGDFSIRTIRSGPAVLGQFRPMIYDFERSLWRVFTEEATPQLEDPHEYVAFPMAGTPPGLTRYRDPDSGYVYIRIQTTGAVLDPYYYSLDLLELQGVLTPGGSE